MSFKKTNNKETIIQIDHEITRQNNQLEAIKINIAFLHEDLQFDYEIELKKLLDGDGC